MNPLKQLRLQAEKRQLQLDYHETFCTPHGSRVLAHILRVAGVTVPTLQGEPNALLMQEGMRRLALSIFRQVHTSVDALPAIMVDELHRIEDNQKDQQT